MSAILVTSTSTFTSTNDTSLSASFVLVVAKRMGLCVHMTEKLHNVLRLNAILQIVICVLGIVGAALSLRVTCVRKNRSSVSVQVAVLSLYDLVFLSTVLILAAFHLAGVNDITITGLCYLLRQLGHWGVTYTMVDITVERCVSIARPFLARKLRRVTFTLKRSAAILVVGVVLACPCGLDIIFGFSEEAGCREGRSLTTYGVVYKLYIGLLLLYILPFLWIVVANVRLIYVLRQMNHRHRHAVTGSSVADPSTKQLSAFVVGLSVWYSTCMVTPSILFLVRLTRVELFRPERDMIVASAADTLVVLSTAANFLFYFLMWRNFRYSFLDIFCTRCRGLDVSHSSELPTSPLAIAAPAGPSVSGGSQQRVDHQSHTVSTSLSDP